MKRLASSILLAAVFSQRRVRSSHAQAPPAVEFIFETAPFPSVHASTIAETRDGLVTAWFGGTREGANDVGIWVSRTVNGKWTPPIEVGNGVQADGTRHPSWNPVLFELRRTRADALLQSRPEPPRMVGDGAHLERQRPHLGRRAAVCPTVFSDRSRTSRCGCPTGRSSRRAARNRPRRPAAGGVHFERSRDGGATWTSCALLPLRATADRCHSAEHPDSRGRQLQALGRSRSGRVFETWSSDRGRTWTRFVDRPAESQRRDRCRDAERRPSPARLQSHAERTHAAERRDVARWQGMARPCTCSRRSRASTRIPRSFRRPTISCTLRTRGGAAHQTRRRRSGNTEDRLNSSKEHRMRPRAVLRGVLFLSVVWSRRARHCRPRSRSRSSRRPTTTRSRARIPC